MIGFIPLVTDSVVYYMGEAEVFRSARVKRTDRVRLLSLPLKVSNLRIWVSSGVVLSHTVKDTFIPANPKEYKRLQTEYKNVERKLSSLESRYRSLKYENDLIESYIKKETQLPPKTLLAMSNRLQTNLLEMDSIGPIKDSLNKVKQNLKVRLQKLKVRQLILEVKLRNFKGGKIFVSYTVKSRWLPRYVLRADPTKGKVTLEADIELETFSGLPIKTEKVVITTLPPPIYSPPKHRRWILRSASVRAMGMKMESEVVLAEAEPPPPQPKISSTFISTRYEYRGPIEIPHIGSTRIPLFKKEYDAEFLFFAYPEIAPRGYMKAVIKPDVDLPKGKMAVYVASQLMSNYFYDGAERNTPDTLFVGYYPFIKGEVVLIKQSKKRRGKGKKLYTVEFREEEIRVKNVSDIDLDVVVYARKPFAGTNVRILSVKFKPKFQKDMGDGLLMWKVHLKSGSSFTLRRQIEVEYPTGSPINW
ncbi:MAG: DUF4139 domain-containing protein [Thermotogae bacterium]|nr:DUF4139 domain-containing protein [Thermotogota bacterium]